MIFEKGAIALKAILVLKSRGEWERFMRFMERYAKANDLDFVGSRFEPARGVDVYIV